MFYLSIAAIARGEAPYVDEWATYHFGMGVEHIYFYNNDPDVTAAIRMLGFGKDRVTVVPFQGETMQTRMTEHALTKYRNDSRWIAFIDVDEFLVPLKTDNLQTFLKPYEPYPAVCPHWYLFGSSGREVYEPIPVIERFTRRAAEVDRHIKSIVDPRRTGKWVTVHKYTHDTSAVDEHFRPIAETDSRPEPASADLVQINHYVTKSYAECKERRNRPRADIAAKHDFEVFFPSHDRKEVEDLRALTLWRTICGKQ
jgi:hypothetical protein